MRLIRIYENETLKKGKNGYLVSINGLEKGFFRKRKESRARWFFWWIFPWIWKSIGSWIFESMDPWRNMRCGIHGFCLEIKKKVSVRFLHGWTSPMDRPILCDPWGSMKNDRAPILFVWTRKKSILSVSPKKIINCFRFRSPYKSYFYKNGNVFFN